MSIKLMTSAICSLPTLSNNWNGQHGWSLRIACYSLSYDSLHDNAPIKWTFTAVWWTTAAILEPDNNIDCSIFLTKPITWIALVYVTLVTVTRFIFSNWLQSGYCHQLRRPSNHFIASKMCFEMLGYCLWIYAVNQCRFRIWESKPIQSFENAPTELERFGWGRVADAVIDGMIEAVIEVTIFRDDFGVRCLVHTLAFRHRKLWWRLRGPATRRQPLHCNNQIISNEYADKTWLWRWPWMPFEIRGLTRVVFAMKSEPIIVSQVKCWPLDGRSLVEKVWEEWKPLPSRNEWAQLLSAMSVESCCGVVSRLP